MKVVLRVDRHIVVMETDFKPADVNSLFLKLANEVVRKMDFILASERKGKRAGAPEADASGTEPGSGATNG